ncbi:MAG: polysaccharide deacetylase family protein [Euryarchaeota archaeon]|jgi:peptidoglycan/xylan/chitin deacetylase (PgdA/CDA1 family)|nr:polysaccharide deacetylase family protein [Euryarchaeota archaeon]
MNRTSKEIIFKLSDYTGLSSPKLWPAELSPRILNYHHVLPSQEIERNSLLYGYTHSLVSFESQMCFIQEKIGTSLSFDQEKHVVVTFDDCSRSVYKHALPVLRRYGIKAYFFLVETSIDQILDIDKYFAWLSWLPKEKFLIRGTEYDFGEHANRLKAHHALWKELINGTSINKLLDDMNHIYSFELLESKFLKSNDRLRVVSQEMVDEIKSEGHFVGFHSRTHPVFSSLTKSQAIEEASPRNNDLYNCQVMAIPFGTRETYSLETIDILKSSGYDVILLNENIKHQSQLKGRINLPDTSNISEIKLNLSRYLLRK